LNPEEAVLSRRFWLFARGAGNFVLGTASKVAIALLVAAVAIFGLRAYRIHQVQDFCGDNLIGTTRAATEKRATESGFAIYRGNAVDEISPRGWSPVLAWCRMTHEQGKILRVAVVVE
jgi:hypothetical protein